MRVVVFGCRSGSQKGKETESRHTKCHPRIISISLTTNEQSSRGRTREPDAIVLERDLRRPIAPTATRPSPSASASAPTARRRRRRRGLRGVSSGAARATRAVLVLVLVLALGVRVVLDAAVEPEVDRALALAGRAVLALALARGAAAAHEPYGVLDELHRGAEDGRGELRVGGACGARTEVRRAVEVHVDARVGRVRVDALLVFPEGVVVWEAQELPAGVFCGRRPLSVRPCMELQGKTKRTVAGFAQNPVAKVWPYSIHPPLVNGIVVADLYMLRENAVFALRQPLLRLTWRAMDCCIRIPDFDNILEHSKVCTTAFPAIGTLNQWGQCCHIFLWLS